MNRLKPEKLREIQMAYWDGKSLRETAREYRVAKKTVQDIFRAERKESLGFRVPCICGQTCGHKGWCSYRFARSPKRQAVMKRLHARQRIGH